MNYIKLHISKNAPISILGKACAIKLYNFLMDIKNEGHIITLNNDVVIRIDRKDYNFKFIAPFRENTEFIDIVIYKNGYFKPFYQKARKI